MSNETKVDLTIRDALKPHPVYRRQPATMGLGYGIWFCGQCFLFFDGPVPSCPYEILLRVPWTR